jgi:hypothetical protein
VISPRATFRFHNVKNTKSPLWMAGSMDPLNTTTMGLSLPVTSIKLYQMIKAEATIIPNDSACPRSYAATLSSVTNKKQKTNRAHVHPPQRFDLARCGTVNERGKHRQEASAQTTFWTESIFDDDDDEVQCKPTVGDDHDVAGAYSPSS